MNTKVKTLTPTKVANIRHSYFREGQTMTSISKRQKVSRNTVSRIVNGQSYTNLYETRIPGFENYILYPDEISNALFVEIDEPFNYYVLRLNYFREVIYFYFDENMDMIGEKYFNSAAHFNREEILVTLRGDYTAIMNRNGKILYIGK